MERLLWIIAQLLVIMIKSSHGLLSKMNLQSQVLEIEHQLELWEYGK